MDGPSSGETAARVIEQRDIEFDLTGVDLGRWHAQGAQVSHLLNALSQFFPEGEKFFIESVRHYKDRITDPVLQKQVQGFIGQEAMHGREHRAYNEALKKAGYPIDALEQKVMKELRFAKKVWGPKGRLASTIALEHLTAIMAHQVLYEPRVLAGCDPKMAALWRWHAVEETEHKAVAFDVYQAVVGRGFQAWLLRVFTLITSTLRFFFFVMVFHRTLLKNDPAPRAPGGWKALGRFLLGQPGVLRRIMPSWFGYFRPRFHPWQHDNRAAVETWKAALAANGAPPG